MAAPHPERQRQTRDRIAQLFAHPASVYLIHYACQSLEQEARHGAPRVAAVAIRHLESGVVTSFSIHAEAELQHLSPVQTLTRMDSLERAMLDKLYAFIEMHRAMRFVHWGMRDEVFGFAAIGLRYAILGGAPVVLPESGRVDLSRLLTDVYGTGFVAPPQFANLGRMNRLPTQGMLTGLEEAEAFERGEYGTVKRSTLTKINLMFEVLHLAHDRTLKTNAGWWVMNLGRMREAYELFERNPVQALAGIAIPIVGAAFGLVLKWLG